MGFVDQIKTGWPVIKAAPFTVAGLCALFAAGGFGVSTFAYTREISTVNAENVALQGDVDRLKGENGSKEHPFESASQCPPGSFPFQNVELRAKETGVFADSGAIPCFINTKITAKYDVIVHGRP
jgi:hypothetical protein